MEEEEDKSGEEADEAFAASDLLAELDEELEEPVEEAAEGQPLEDFFDGSWPSQASGLAGVVGPASVAASNYSVESDGQNLEKLRNLQKLYQEGFITVTEYKDRRVQLVDELSEADQSTLQNLAFSCAGAPNMMRLIRLLSW
jgi:hypothetical protein